MFNLMVKFLESARCPFRLIEEYELVGCRIAEL